METLLAASGLLLGNFLSMYDQRLQELLRKRSGSPLGHFYERLAKAYRAHGHITLKNYTSVKAAMKALSQHFNSGFLLALIWVFFRDLWRFFSKINAHMLRPYDPFNGYVLFL